MQNKKQITKEIPGEKAAHVLFTIVATLYGKDEYYRSKAFTDNITPEDDLRNKREYEIQIRSLLNEIASFPEEGTIKPLHDKIMAQPPVVRAYLMVWFGEMSEDFQRMKTVEIPYPPSLQAIVHYLLQSAKPFWRW
jgi:hypothetical protein